MLYISFAIENITIILVKIMKLLRHFLDQALKKRKYGKRFYVVQKTEDGLGYVLAIKAMNRKRIKNDNFNFSEEWELFIDYNKFKGRQQQKNESRYRTNFLSALCQRRVFPCGNVRSIKKDDLIMLNIYPKEHYRYYQFSWSNLKYKPNWPIGLEDVGNFIQTPSRLLIFTNSGTIILQYDTHSNSYILTEQENSSNSWLETNKISTKSTMEISESLPSVNNGDEKYVSLTTPSPMDVDCLTEGTNFDRSHTVENESKRNRNDFEVLSSFDEENVDSPPATGVDVDSKIEGTDFPCFLTEENEYGFQQSFRCTFLAKQDTPDMTNHTKFTPNASSSKRLELHNDWKKEFNTSFDPNMILLDNDDESMKFRQDNGRNSDNNSGVPIEFVSQLLAQQDTPEMKNILKCASESNILRCPDLNNNLNEDFNAFVENDSKCGDEINIDLLSATGVDVDSEREGIDFQCFLSALIGAKSNSDAPIEIGNTPLAQQDTPEKKDNDIKLSSDATTLDFGIDWDELEYNASFDVENETYLDFNSDVPVELVSQNVAQQDTPR